MMWKVQFFKSARGEKLIEIYISTLPSRSRAKIIRLIDLLEKRGSLVKMPYVKKVTNNISELRARGKIEVRLFFTIKGRVIYILHGFTKKTQKIPIKEIKIALKRLALI